MDVRLIIEQFSHFVTQVPGLDEYINSHSDVTDMRDLIESFRDEMKAEGRMTYQLDLMLKILLERWSMIEEFSPSRGIFSINVHQMIDDQDILNQFFDDIRDKERGVCFKRAEIQHYSTIREKIAYLQVDYNDIYEKYLDCNHPYICSHLALAFINAKNYDIGLVFLQKALVHVFSAPNIYWHNHLAITGCVDALHEFQHLLGRNGMTQLGKVFPGGTHFILKCLFLLLSRVIYMCDNDKKSNIGNDYIPQSVVSKINYLSIRADLLYHYRMEFSAIFGKGINPDIQFMSDKAYAHSIAEEYGIGIITKDAYFDSLKMYQHGSLIPNNTGGYAESEEATWGELIERGKRRNEQLAAEYYEAYNSGKFFISHSNLADAIGYLHEVLVVDSTITYDHYITKRSTAYRSAWESFQQEFIYSSTHDKLLANFKQVKSCALEIQDCLNQNKIQYLYHFTDRRNLASIIENQGLLSWKYCSDNDIIIPNPGGDTLSRELDTRHGLQDYVRLSFCSDHPMSYRLKCNGADLVLLKIKVDAAWSKDTLFSDINAASSYHHHGADLSDLQRIDFNAVKRRFVRRDDPDFAKHQAEVLVKTFIPIEYIVNIENPESL